MTLAVFLLPFAAIALVLYLFATQDDPYVPVADRPRPRKSLRKSVNWYAFRGPLFTEDPDWRDPAADAEEYFEGNHGLPLHPDGAPPGSVAPRLTRKCGQRRGDPGTLYDALEHCHDYARDKCRMNLPVTAERGWINERQNCSYRAMEPDQVLGHMGSYTQCTNNNLDVPNNLVYRYDALNRDLINPKNNVSHACYAAKFAKCMAGENLPNHGAHR